MEIVPVPVNKLKIPLVVVRVVPPVPVLIFTDVAPVIFPIVTTLAVASVPTLIAPVPVTNANVPLVVV